MAHVDLRDWLEQVDAHGEIEHISGASWDLEMGAIAELVYRDGKNPKPALLFEDIPGYPKGCRTSFGLLGSIWRIGKTIGLPVETSDAMTALRAWHERSRDVRRIPPRFVSSGPVKTNVLTGKQIDLFKFPVPKFHELDGGRYIGTSHAVLQKDPDAGWVNLGTYRIMVVDRDRLALHICQGQHGETIMHQKYLDRGRVMPVAIAIGIDPVLWWLSCQRRTPWGVSEYDDAGGIKGEPIEVFEGQYTGLPLPAHAEIVIEGECHPGEYIDEGPFGEWHGYYSNRGLSPVPEPIIRVKAIYYREDPILTCSQVGEPPNSNSLMLAFSSAAGIWDSLEAIGVPGVQGVWCQELGSGFLFNIVSIKQMYPGHSRQVGLLASQYPPIGKYTVVVEEDIDPSNIEQVIWAMVTRKSLERSIQVLPYCRTTGNVDPAVPLSEKRETEKPKPITAPRVFIDACRDMEWQPDWYPIAHSSADLRNKTLEKWQSVLSRLLPDGFIPRKS